MFKVKNFALKNKKIILKICILGIFAILFSKETILLNEEFLLITAIFLFFVFSIKIFSKFITSELNSYGEYIYKVVFELDNYFYIATSNYVKVFCKLTWFWYYIFSIYRKGKRIERTFEYYTIINHGKELQHGNMYIQLSVILIEEFSCVKSTATRFLQIAKNELQ